METIKFIKRVENKTNELLIDPDRLLIIDGHEFKDTGHLTPYDQKNDQLMNKGYFLDDEDETLEWRVVKDKEGRQSLIAIKK